MNTFPNIKHMLRSVFNAEDGLSEDAAIRIYKRAATTSGNLDALKKELQLAFSDLDVSWQKMLFNDEFEVLDAATENEAREHAKRMLWDPIFGE